MSPGSRPIVAPILLYSTLIATLSPLGTAAAPESLPAEPTAHVACPLDLTAVVGSAGCEWLAKATPGELLDTAAAMQAEAESSRQRLGINREALSRLLNDHPELTLPSAPGELRARIGRFDAERPYRATADELTEVRRLLDRYAFEIDEDDLAAASKSWYVGQRAEERTREAVTVASIAAGMTAGALHAAGKALYEHVVYGVEITCIEWMKRVYVGAVNGALFALTPVLAALDFVLTGQETIELFVPKVGEVWELYPALNLVVNWELLELIRWLRDRLGDLLWASSSTRLLATTFCSAVGSNSLRAGSLSSYRNWVVDELIPDLRDEYGVKFQALQTEMESEAAAAQTQPEAFPVVQSSLTLVDASNGRERNVFTDAEIFSWTLDLQVNQIGSYSIELGLLQGGSFTPLDTRTKTTTSEFEPIELTGQIDTQQIVALAGQGSHALAIDVTSTSQGWTRLVNNALDVADSWELEVRANRKPTISLDILELTGLIFFDIFVTDADGIAPQSISLTVDGISQSIPVPSGADWDAGVAIDTISMDLTGEPGSHTAWANVSDGTASAATPSMDFRSASLPFPVFPVQTLDRVGDTQSYSVQWTDDFSGIPGKEIYVYSENSGSLTDLSGEPTAKLVSGSGGWAFFDYTPLETGNHRLHVVVDGFDLTQISNSVLPGCSPTEPVSTSSPYDGEDGLGTTVTLEWFVEEDAGSYDILFDTVDPPAALLTSVAHDGSDNKQSVDATALSEGQLYYWQVVSHAGCDPTEISSSAVRAFSTLGGPGPVQLLKPADGSSGQPTGLVLDWANVTSDGATLYTLYLDDVTPPTDNFEMQTRTESLQTGLAPGTTYHWQVVARSADNPALTSESPIWSFTTGSGSTETVTLPAVRDAGLRAGAFGNTNYGGQVGGPAEQKSFGCGRSDDFYQDPGVESVRGAIGWDLSLIPAGSSIVNATLRLEFVGSSGSQTAPLDIFFDPFTDSWSESTLTWNNRPAIDASRRVVGTFPLSGFNPLENDVTPLVQSWIDGTIANHGVLVSMPTLESESKAKWFYQREWSGDSLAPDLDVTYLVPCQAPASATGLTPAGGTTTADVEVLLDWDDVPGVADFRLRYGTTNPPTIEALATESQLLVSGLTPGATYFWEVEALAACDPTLTTTSATASFATPSCVDPPTVTIAEPGDGATDQPRNVTLTWSAEPGVSQYEVYLADQTPPDLLLTTTTATSLTIATTDSRTYYWYVRAIADCDPQLFSDTSIHAFTTAARPVADAGPDQVAAIGIPLPLGGSASGGTTPYNYGWTVLDAEGGALDSATLPSPSFTASQSGVYSVQLAVTDALGFVSDADQVQISVCNDPGIPQLTVDPNAVSWSASIDATGFDLFRGSLESLHASGGDFSAATESCGATDTSLSTVPATEVPDPGSGFWYLVRARNCGGAGTLDSAGASQAMPRDVGVDGSAVECGALVAECGLIPGAPTCIFAGLEWQSGAAPDVLDWAEASDYCSTLDLAGATDWFLPTRPQLESLGQPVVNESNCYVPSAMLGVCELSVPASDWWSSSTDCLSASRPCACRFHVPDGACTHQGAIDSRWVRCARTPGGP